MTYEIDFVIIWFVLYQHSDILEHTAHSHTTYLTYSRQGVFSPSICRWDACYIARQYDETNLFLSFVYCG